jgi:hypothetical protein
MKTKYEVIDNPFNRENYPDLIGRILDKPPAYAQVKLIKEKMPIGEFFKSAIFRGEKIDSTMGELIAIECLKAGYDQNEIIRGLQEFYHKTPEESSQIFTRAVVKMKNLGKNVNELLQPKKAEFKGWYKKAQIDQNSNQYEATVEIRVLESADDGSWDAEIREKVHFKYNIELEHRSWGIKDINVSFRDVITSTIVITYFDKQGNEIKTENRPISIDMSKLPISYSKGDGIYVTDLDLYLTHDLQVDYDISFISVIKGGR